jgi:hypothetical protein
MGKLCRVGTAHLNSVTSYTPSPSRLGSAVMQIKIQGEIENDPGLASAVSHASRLLEAEAPPSGANSTADWGLSFDECRRPVIHLKLSDRWMADAQAQFTPADLKNESFLESRFNLLWGDLLQERSHKQLRRLEQLVQELDKGD